MDNELTNTNELYFAILEGEDENGNPIYSDFYKLGNHKEEI